MWAVSRHGPRHDRVETETKNSYARLYVLSSRTHTRRERTFVWSRYACMYEFTRFSHYHLLYHVSIRNSTIRQQSLHDKSKRNVLTKNLNNFLKNSIPSNQYRCTENRRNIWNIVMALRTSKMYTNFCWWNFTGSNRWLNNNFYVFFFFQCLQQNCEWLRLHECKVL